MQMVFKPIGVSPRDVEFRCMEFENWRQVARYLDALERPLEALPWVKDGAIVSDPDAVFDQALGTKSL